MEFLRVQDISATAGTRITLHPLRFNLAKGERLGIAGETGSGKTTLLKIIGGLIQPTEGNVYLEGERIEGPLEKLLPGHPKIGYLSQHFELRNHYRVEEELECRNLLSDEAAAEIYRLCRVDHLLKRATTELSGGERQRIVLARLLTTQPSLLLLDEPFSNLDALHTEQMKAVLEDIISATGLSTILVSHEGRDLLSWANRILVIKEGAMVQEGSPTDLYYHPVNEYAAGLFGAFNTLVTPATGAKTFIRPENMVFTNEKDALAEGVLVNILFFGAFRRGLVQTDPGTWLVDSTEAFPAIGSRVRIALRR